MSVSDMLRAYEALEWEVKQLDFVFEAEEERSGLVKIGKL